MKNVNEQNVSTPTTPKAPRTEEIKRELTDQEIASVAGGATASPPIRVANPPVANS